MTKQNFKELAEQTRSRLKERGGYLSSSDLYVNEEVGVAVIGIQTSQNSSGHDTAYLLRDSGHDTIYLLRNNGKLETILDGIFRSGRMFPTGISEDGKQVFYTVKNESGEFNEKEYQIK